jgi:hypothetical protein
MTNKNFDDLRPYYDEEINQAMHRITDDPLFSYIADFLYPNVPVNVVKEKFRSLNSIYDFQIQIMQHAINTIVEKSISEFTWGGYEQLEKDKAYLFVSNHRDILLDSALSQVFLHTHNFNTSEITFGSNLMKSQFVVDIGKSNKMFKVERGGNPRDLYANSKHLSDYIRYTLLHKKESIWIAQRNGRTKNGNDTTDPGLIRMFSMSGGNDIVKNIEELNIVPISISYQNEPCDFLKMKELFLSRETKYIKAPDEDLNSIITGIIQPKGKVHIEFTKQITGEVLSGFSEMNNKNFIVALAKFIDNNIYEGYKLFNTNYIAYDILNNSTAFLDKEYTKEESRKFIEEMTEKVNLINGNKDELKEIYLGMYANPVKNMLYH